MRHFCHRARSKTPAHSTLLCYYATGQMNYMDIVLSLCVGIALSAACGFRVFVPLLILSIAAKTGHVTLVPSFQWLASDIALGTFAVATVLEIAGYYIP